MKRALLPLNALRVFDAAARHLSFKVAADELAVTPAAVSQQIRSLEDYLGVVLFKRQARSLTLTEEARRSLPALRAGFERFEEAMSLADHPTFGLAASVYTTNINKAIKSARSIQAGTVWVNDWGRKSDLTSPFGGYKQSGIGKDMGLAGYQKYRKTKSVWIQS